MNRTTICSKRAFSHFLLITLSVFASFTIWADTATVDFETYSLGSVNGQDGWSMTGPYDVEIVSNTYGYATFGSQSLRISNAVTSGSFGDHAFSKPVADEAGESTSSDAFNGGLSGGTRQPYFEAEWDFASTVPGSEQPGLSTVASPDRGDGARMSWVQMTDTPTGLEVNFFDYQISADPPVGDFVSTNVASGLDRTVPHRIKITMEFIDGPENDIVKVYVDGTLMHTGTSWEDFFRQNQPPGTRTVDCVLFRVGGTAAPATLGNGFVIDNFRVLSGPIPCTTDCYVNDATGNDANSGASPGDAKKTIQAAVNQVNVSGNVHVASGTYTEQVTINKSLNMIGAGAVTTIIKAPATIPIASNPASSVVDIDGAGVSVDMGGFTVSGPGPSGCGSIGAGIFVRGSAFANIHDNKVLDIRDHPISGCQNGIGILVGRVSFAASGTAIIKNNEISGYQKGGIVISNIGSSATIEDNTVTGAGAVNFIAQNGVQISGGATGNIKHNTVSGHSFTPFTFASTGVLIFGSDADTDDNTLSENQVGIYHIEGSGTHKLNDISASFAGTGSPGFWGIVADPGGIPRVRPEVFDAPVASLQKSRTENTIAATYTSLVDQNTLTGDGSAGGVGLEADVFGTDVLNFTATANTITNWEYGIYLYRDPTATLNANIIDCNQIFGNTAFGVFNSTGVTANAAGNWWGAIDGPSGVGSGSGDAVSADVTFAPWAANASCGGFLAHNFVFLGNQVVIERSKQIPSQGNIHSNGKIDFLRGDPTTFEGNLRAVGNIKIDKENTIDGNATAGGAVTVHATSDVLGTITSGASVSTEPLPTLTYSAGGLNKTIPQNGTLALAPGSYNIVTMNGWSTLKLSSGAYNLNQLKYVGEESVIEIDVTSGPVTVNVVSNLQLGKDIEIRILPGGEAGSTSVTFNTKQSANVTIGKEAYLLGNLNAPNATVVLSNNTQFRGAICAKGIQVKRDVFFLHHSSSGTLPGPGQLPKSPEGDDDEEEVSSDQSPVISYEMHQNYPNPFNPSTQISFALPEAGEVTLSIFAGNGQLVRQLVSREMAAGRHNLRWDGRNHSGNFVAAGVYLYRLVARDQNGNAVFNETKRMTLLK